MDLIDPQVIASAEQVLKQLQGFFLSLLQPFRLWQVVIVIGVFALAHVLARLGPTGG